MKKCKGNKVRTRKYTALMGFVFSLFSVTSLLAQDVISTGSIVSNGTGQPISDHVVAQFIRTSAVANINSLGLPAVTDIAALHQIDESNILFALKSTTELNLVNITKGDVLKWNAGSISLFASNDELGIGPATGIDAISLDGDTLIFSTDISDTVGGVAISDSDLLAWSGSGAPIIRWPQSTCGIPHDTDLSGIHLATREQILMSFKSAAKVGGVAIAKGDIASCDMASGKVAVYRRFSDLGPEWAAVNIDAISLFLSNTVFKDSFEDLNN